MFLLTIDNLKALVEKTPLFVLIIQPKDRIIKWNLQEITEIIHQKPEVVIHLEVLQLEIIVHEEVLQPEAVPHPVEAVRPKALARLEVAHLKKEDKILIKLLWEEQFFLWLLSLLVVCLILSHWVIKIYH